MQLSLPPTLYLEGLPGKYVAVQLHLHWGQKGSLMGSEHQINSKATAAEVPESEAWTSTWWQAGWAPGKGGSGNWKSHMWRITPTLVGEMWGMLKVGVIAAAVRAFGRGWWRNTKRCDSLSPQLHIVHYDSDSYNSLSEAAKSPEGLAVLGILIEVSGPHFLLGLSSLPLHPSVLFCPCLPPKASQQPL